jgi:hypothetical protein
VQGSDLQRSRLDAAAQVRGMYQLGLPGKGEHVADHGVNRLDGDPGLRPAVASGRAPWAAAHAQRARTACQCRDAPAMRRNAERRARCSWSAAGLTGLCAGLLAGRALVNPASSSKPPRLPRTV